MRDPVAVVEHGQKIIDGQMPEDALRGLVAVPTVSPPFTPDDEFPDDDGSISSIDPEPSSYLDSCGLW